MASRPAGRSHVQAVRRAHVADRRAFGPAVKAAAPVADVVGGFSGAVAIMAALMERNQTGEGRYRRHRNARRDDRPDGTERRRLGMSGKGPSRWANGHPLMAPYESFRTADREIVGGGDQRQILASLCRLPEFRKLADDPAVRRACPAQQ